MTSAQAMYATKKRDKGARSKSAKKKTGYTEILVNFVLIMQNRVLIKCVGHACRVGGYAAVWLVVLSFP